MNKTNKNLLTNYKNFSFFYLIIFTILFNYNLAKASEYYQLDSLHSNATWHVDHFGFSTLTGKFTEIDGRIFIDENNLNNCSLNVSINTNSLSTGVKKFDEHLLSSDFLDTSKFPTAKFISRKVNVLRNNQARVIGDLFIRGVKKEEVMMVKLNKHGNNPINANKTLGFSGEMKIKRSNYGISYGLPYVPDEVKISMQVEAISETAINDQKINSNYKSKWQVQADKSKIEFSVMQNDSLVKGKFKSFVSSIDFDPNDLKNSKVEVRIDMTTLDMTYTEALEALKTSSWLAINSYPEAVFRAKKFTILAGQKQYLASGTLTMKGKSIPVNLDFQFKHLDKKYAHMIGKAIIKRSDFEVGNPDPKKANGVDDQVEIMVEIYANRI